MIKGGGVNRSFRGFMGFSGVYRAFAGFYGGLQWFLMVDSGYDRGGREGGWVFYKKRRFQGAALIVEGFG